MRTNNIPSVRLIAALAISLSALSAPAAAEGDRRESVMVSHQVGAPDVAQVVTSTDGGGCAPEWVPISGGMPGVDSLVSALTVFDDGSGPALYVGGWFSTAGGVSANRIAKWDGVSWSPLGSGMNSLVRTLTVFDDGSGPALYAGGHFTTAGGVEVNRVAKWDGSSWSALGSGMNGAVFTLTVFNDGSGSALYAGGLFTTAGSVEVNRIAKWDGSSWLSLGSGMDSGSVSSLTVFDDGSGGGPALYAGGQFPFVGGVPIGGIAKWDGASWLPLGSGMNNTGFGHASPVLALTVFDDGFGGGPVLFAGGDFFTAGGVSVNNVAKWDGVSWSALGSGINGSVLALTVFDDGAGLNLYAGGDFFTSCGETVNCIARWDGLTWSFLGSGMDDAVFTMTIFDDGSGLGPALYTGGWFTTSPAGDAYLAKWQGCPVQSIPGDANGDGVVDFDDLAIVLGQFGQSGAGLQGDLNGDGVVDFDDLAVVLGNFGATS